MRKRKAYKLISWFAVLIWMAFIFFLSHQPGDASSELSSGIVNIASEIITAILPFIGLDLEQLHFIIRKGAHFFAYFTLGILVLHAMTVGRAFTFPVIGIAVIVCVLYAISDEVHQLFIPGRSGEVRDVLIDSAGATAGIGIYMGALSLWNRAFRKG